MFGFLLYRYDIDDDGIKHYTLNRIFNETYTCKDGTSSISFGYDKLTENEIKILDIV